MYIKTLQQQRTAKIIYFTLSLLINASLQTQARNVDTLDDTKRITVAQKKTLGFTGYGTKIGIIDGYFDPKSDTENVLSKSTKLAFSGKDPQLVVTLAQSGSFGGDHANHVSSIIHRKALRAELRVIDIYNEPSVKDAGNHNARLIAAIDAAIESKVDFINLSLRISPDNDVDGKISKDLKKAFYRARDAGIGIIKSAGNNNEFTDSTSYTKSLVKLLYKMKGSMIIVGAVAYDDEGHENLASFSNKAGMAYKYTVSAPGKDILAYGASNRLVKMSGTSMAAPVVTATASLLKEAYPDFSAKDILKSIRRSARKVSFDQKTYYSEGKYGRGIVDFHAALIEAEELNKSRSSEVQ